MKDGNYAICCIVCRIITVIVSLGAISWGLTAFFQLDLVTTIFGLRTAASYVVYGVVAISGVLKLIGLFICCPCCKKGICTK